MVIKKDLEKNNINYIEISHVKELFNFKISIKLDISENLDKANLSIDRSLKNFYKFIKESRELIVKSDDIRSLYKDYEEKLLIIQNRKILNKKIKFLPIKDSPQKRL